jgi:hypothetical protein
VLLRPWERADILAGVYSRFVSAGITAALLLHGARAMSAGPLPANGEPIQTSEYRIDMVQGPVLGSSRVTGLAGAYAPIAEGVDGIPVNAASPAVRMPWSVDYFDYDLGLGFTSASSLKNTDFDNNGTVRFDDGTSQAGNGYERFLFATLGGTFQVGEWGIGAGIDVQTYRLGESPTVQGAPPNLNVEFGRTHLLLARAFLSDTLVVGGGLRAAAMTISATENVNGSGNKVDLVKMAGAGLEGGVLLAPRQLPLRVGISYRPTVVGTTESSNGAVAGSGGDQIVGIRYLPNEIVLPWEFEAGIAFQFGKRRLNVPWVNPVHEKRRYLRELDDRLTKRTGANRFADRAMREDVKRKKRQAIEHIRNALKARYKAMSRQKVLLTASVLVTGPVTDGVGVESFLRSQVERSGQWVTYQPRIGVETEPIEHRLQVRAGGYVEPSRFDTDIVRGHGTAGFDLRVLEWSVFGIYDDDTTWRVGGFVDGARHYLGWGVSVGVWH